MSSEALLARLVRGQRSKTDGFALAFLSDRQPTVIRETRQRADVAAAAAACAAVLTEAGVREGDAIVVALGTGPAFVGWLLGAMTIGAVPVPVPAPAKSSAGAAGVDRFQTVVAHCAPRAIVGEAHALSIARSARIPAVLIAPATMPGPGARPPVVPAPEFPDRPAFIQYTAGSTGTPKGVVVTFGNLHANLEAIGKAVRVGPRDRVLSWLPLHHDMGLVGALLFSLYWDLPLFLFSPVGFVLRPVGWLEAISAHRATLSPAPHFAYSVCALKLRDEALSGIDLSSWRCALDGAEPIRAANARAFIERFRPYGFRDDAYQPVYGLSEATLAVTFPAIGEGLRIDRVLRSSLARGVAEPALPDADIESDAIVDVVAVGRPLEGVHVEIHDPVSGKPLPDRTLGEIWLRGPSVSPRYLGENEPDRGVLHTGDLGYLADGVLYIADRLKDLIIQGGENIYPTEVEGAVAEVAGVRAGRIVAFGVTRPELGTEEVVVAAEVKRGAHRATLPAAIRAAVQQQSGIVLGDIVLLEPGTLPLTTSGKLMRSRVHDAYLEGSLGKRGIGKWISGLHRRAVLGITRATSGRRGR